MKILITGTSRGLGYALAHDLSLDHEVIGLARSEMQGTPWTQIRCDLNNREDLARIKTHLGEAEVLINNAAVGYDGLLAVQGIEEIETLIQVNLVAPIILSKFWSRQRLARRKAGMIINITSICGIRGYAGLAVYGATKAGLDGFTRSLARELGAKGFRVNSVLPGYMETDMSSGLDSEKKNMIVRRTPLGRLATVADIVPVVKFLISDAAGFITGQTLIVDGGATL